MGAECVFMQTHHRGLPGDCRWRPRRTDTGIPGRGVPREVLRGRSPTVQFALSAAPATLTSRCGKWACGARQKRTSCHCIQPYRVRTLTRGERHCARRTRSLGGEANSHMSCHECQFGRLRVLLFRVMRHRSSVSLFAQLSGWLGKSIAKRTTWTLQKNQQHDAECKERLINAPVSFCHKQECNERFAGAACCTPKTEQR